MDHESFMTRAIELSKSGLGRTFPNPIVGAVIVSPSGEIIGEGFHARGDHAEVVAIHDCHERGNSTLDATIYVTLEPCNHTGKTPPCTEAIVVAGICRVIFSVRDPNPIAQGGGDFLKAQGVEVVPNLLEAEAAFVNRAWLHKITHSRPYFIWKIASTFDGYTAALDGTSKWLTSDESRESVQQMRAESDAILIGTGTALADNPSLTPRGHTRRPIRIVMGERDLPPDMNVLDQGAQTIVIQSRDTNELIEAVIGLEINSVLVEAGSTLGTSLLRAGLIDEIVWYQAPTLLGAGKKAISEMNINTLSQAVDFEILDVQKIGADICTQLLAKKTTEVHI